jgi:hypothetical protein
MRVRPLEIIRDWRKGPVPSPAQERRLKAREVALVRELLTGAKSETELCAATRLHAQAVRATLAGLWVRHRIGVHGTYLDGEGGFGLWDVGDTRVRAQALVTSGRAT